jgi:hypothetical protein
MGTLTAPPVVRLVIVSRNAAKSTIVQFDYAMPLAAEEE